MKMPGQGPDGLDDSEDVAFDSRCDLSQCHTGPAIRNSLYVEPHAIHPEAIAEYLIIREDRRQ